MIGWACVGHQAKEELHLKSFTLPCGRKYGVGCIFSHGKIVWFLVALSDVHF
jgi:hypothetical protein